MPGKGPIVLTTLALLAVIGTVPPAGVDITLTGERREPVSAAPRTLSDVARDRRQGLTAVGGFSAVETTVPRSVPRWSPPVELEEEAAESEPEIVEEPPPAYVPTYVATWYGGCSGYGGHRPRISARSVTPAPGPRHGNRPSAPLARQPFPRHYGISARASDLGGRATRIFTVTRP
jgi:hypothetical protein